MDFLQKKVLQDDSCIGSNVMNANRKLIPPSYLFSV